MDKLVILDFGNAYVHFYDVEAGTEIDEEYIGNLGYNLDECSWLFGEGVNITFHNEVLK